MPTADQQQVLDAIHGHPHRGAPSWMINLMEWRMIDRLAGVPEGTYEQEPDATYRAMLRAADANMVDQWLPHNPLTMGSAGYGEERERNATTGGEEIVRDGIVIREPEDVLRHLEEVIWPELEAELAGPPPTAEAFLKQELKIQAYLGDQVLKVPHACIRFPGLRYVVYGYGPYFMAYALYPEMMERDFRLQGQVIRRRNAAIARAIVDHGRPPVVRLDHDMADSRGTLVRIETLDELWFPHFLNAIEPALQAGLKLVWHCDGNLMEMVPRLLEAGIHGFQGFQYEDGMDYEAICQMKTREGDDLLIYGGVSVTRTLPLGTPGQIRDELAWLVEHAPANRLILGVSSSITPGVPWENLQTLFEGLRYYRQATIC